MVSVKLQLFVLAVMVTMAASKPVPSDANVDIQPSYCRPVTMTDEDRIVNDQEFNESDDSADDGVTKFTSTVEGDQVSFSMTLHRWHILTDRVTLCV